MVLAGIDFQGLGYSLGATDKPPKKKKETPEVLPPLPPPVAVSKSAVPKWLPYAVGGVGTLIIIGLLVTSKGKN